jgi:hypothetical protein
LGGFLAFGGICMNDIPAKVYGYLARAMALVDFGHSVCISSRASSKEN